MIMNEQYVDFRKRRTIHVETVQVHM